MKLVLLVVFALSLFGNVDAQQLNANAGPNVSICSGGPVTLGGTPSATGGTGSYTYNWSPATGLSCTNCPNPVCTATSNITYTLTVAARRAELAAGPVEHPLRGPALGAGPGHRLTQRSELGSLR